MPGKECVILLLINAYCFFILDDCSSYIGADDGVYHILANMKLVPVFCEFSSDGAWTVCKCAIGLIFIVLSTVA